MATPLLELRSEGLYCALGDFYIDPWRGVKRALITHGHSDHARWGCGAYLTSSEGRDIVQRRVGAEAAVSSIPYGETKRIGSVTVSFHPAGHILGSAQILVESAEGERWVVSGDYKTEPDATCAPFELVRCHTFITESTFSLPVYRWSSQSEVFQQINSWWAENRANGVTSVIFAYSLGKAQRVLGGVDWNIGPIVVHGAVWPFVDLYRAQGKAMPLLVQVSELEKGAGALVVAPPSAQNTAWLRRFSPYRTAFASGWMAVRGAKRRRGVDRGFVLSDHVDWPAVNRVIRDTGAESIGITHGYTSALCRWLRESGFNAWTLDTQYEGDPEVDDEEEETP